MFKAPAKPVPTVGLTTNCPDPSVASFNGYTWVVTNVTDSFATSQTAVACAPMAAASNSKKEINPMYVDTPRNDKSIESTKINYLMDRVYSTTHAKKTAIHKDFRLDVPPVPTTPEELVEKIKNGEFTIKAKTDDDRYGWGRRGVMDNIVWRAPDVAPDDAGAAKAYKDLDEAVKLATDVIMIKAPADGLAALQALEAWEPTGKPN